MDAVQNLHDTAQQCFAAITQQRAALTGQRLQGDGLSSGDDDDSDAAQAAVNAPAGTGSLPAARALRPPHLASNPAHR